MNSVKLYPTLDDSDIKLDVKSKRTYRFKNEIIEEVLVDESSLLYTLEDRNNKWNSKQDGLLLDLDLSIKGVDKLFGIDGIAYKDTILGVGLEWKPIKSRIKQSKKLGTINSKDSIFNCKVTDISLNDLSSDIEFNVLIYINRPGSAKTNLFGNEQGLILGKIKAWELSLTGNGSTFPTKHINDPNMPLWSIYSNFDDPNEELFDEDNLCILVNQAHPDYLKITQFGKDYDKSFAREVLSSSIACLLYEICSKREFKNVSKENVEKGTISYFVIYLEKQLGFRLDGSFSDIIRSVKMYFDSEMKA